MNLVDMAQVLRFTIYLLKLHLDTSGIISGNHVFLEMGDATRKKWFPIYTEYAPSVAFHKCRFYLVGLHLVYLKWKDI